MKRIFYISSLLAIILLTSCENDNWSFPDYKYTTVYFPYQSPVRTIVLGDDIYDNTLDNQHKCMIMATTGGVYENKKDIMINFSVENSLCENLKFETLTGNSVVAMPSSYYILPDVKQIQIKKGVFSGGIEVKLTDAFFADTNAIKNTYVIPLKINSVIGADSVLSGKSELTNPDLRVSANWIIAPKNYILYAVKYINTWHGSYLRRGKEVATGNNGNTQLDTTVVYHAKYVEWDQVCKVSTKSLTEVQLSLNGKNRDNTNLPYTLNLKFNEDGTCNITSPGNATYSITGTGKFVKNGDFWGEKQRNVIHANYTIQFNNNTTHIFSDTLVIRDRGVKFETFNPVVSN